MNTLNYKLPKSIRICKKKHFEYIFQNAVKIENKYLKVWFIKSWEDKRKVAFIASTYLGNAVHRNQYKRKLRELFRLNQHQLSKEYDFIFIAKKRLTEPSFEKLTQSFLALLNEHKLLYEDNHYTDY